MKICIINSFYYPNIVGGAEISVQKLAEGLALNGNEVHVICTGKNEKKVINNVYVHRICINNICQTMDILLNKQKKITKLERKIYNILDFYNIFNKKLLYNILLNIKPDVIHINNIYGFSNIIWQIIKNINIPSVFTARDYSLLCGINNVNNIKSKIKSKIVKKITNNIDIITAPSECTLNIFKKYGYFKTSKYITVYNAIDFDNISVKKILYKKKSELLQNKTNIKFVYLGRLESNKGIDILLNSFIKIFNNNLELLIAGDGALKNLVIKFQNRDKRIKYLGFLDQFEVNKLLSTSDVLIIPSIWEEPFGRVILDAYKNCMPVIGSNIGGIPEVIKDNFSGKLFNPGDESELIESINYFSKSNNILRIIDNCVIQLNEFSIGRQINRFLDIYNSIT